MGPIIRARDCKNLMRMAAVRAREFEGQGHLTCSQWETMTERSWFRLFRLSTNDLFRLAAIISRTPGQDSAKLDKHDEQGCTDYICAHMNSSSLLELEDEGVLQLLFLKDMIADLMHDHE